MRSEGTTESSQANLTIITVNVRGVIGGESISGSNTPGRTSLNRVVNERQANVGNDGIAIILFVSPDRIDDKTRVTPGGAVLQVQLQMTKYK